MAIPPASLSSFGKSLSIKGAEGNNTSTKNLTLSELKGPDPTTDRLDAVKVKHFVETAVDAVGSIIDLREKQAELVAQAGNSNSEARVEISEELNAISTEITRISTEATYNGRNVLNGGTFTIQSSAKNYSATVSVANSTSISTVYNLNTGTAGTLTRAGNSLNDALFTARNVATNLSSREYKAANVIEDLSSANGYSSVVLTESETGEEKSTIQKLAAELTRDLLATEGDLENPAKNKNEISLANSQVGALIDELI